LSIKTARGHFPFLQKFFDVLYVEKCNKLSNMLYYINKM
jgi:hypothetical protein